MNIFPVNDERMANAAPKNSFLAQTFHETSSRTSKSDQKSANACSTCVALFGANVLHISSKSVLATFKCKMREPRVFAFCSLENTEQTNHLNLIIRIVKNVS